MNKITDIEGKELTIGDTVYYARKQNYSANGELLKLVISHITTDGKVKMNKYTSTEPNRQLLKIK